MCRGRGIRLISQIDVTSLPRVLNIGSQESHVRLIKNENSKFMEDFRNLPLVKLILKQRDYLSLYVDNIHLFSFLLFISYTLNYREILNPDVFLNKNQLQNES